MKIIELPFFPKRWAMSFAGIIWCHDKGWIDQYVVNHEAIHLRQQMEMLFIPFYIGYVFEWLFLSLRHRNPHQGYRHILAEQEAYSHDHDLDYLRKRRPFAQFHRQSYQH